MFKVREKIICITNSNGTLHFHLTLNKMYEVIKLRDDDYIYIKNDNNVTISYPNNLFISLTEYRRMKLEKNKIKVKQR